jgi:hypothetical protein
MKIKYMTLKTVAEGAQSGTRLDIFATEGPLIKSNRRNLMSYILKITRQFL